MAAESSIINNLKVYVRKCIFQGCDKSEIYTERWKEHWHPYQDGYICKKHYSKLYQQKNREKQIQYVKNYYYRNLALIRKKNTEHYHTCVKNIKEYHKTNRLKLIILLGNKCIRCGFTDIRALQLDHINDDGYLDKQNMKHHHSIITYYYSNPEIAKQRLQILCANCNWIKRFEMKKHNQHNR